MGGLRCRAVTHSISIDVRFSELDPYGHLNHAVYATYFETARIVALDESDLALGPLAEQGYQFVVTRLVLDYKRPAVANDTVEVTTWVSQMRRASTTWSQAMHRGDELLATAAIRSAITDTTGRPTRPPAWVFERLGPLIDLDDQR